MAFAFGLIKLSILFFYRKIFCSSRNTKSVFDHVTKAIIVIIAIWTVAFGTGMVFICGDEPTAAWDIVAVVAVKCSAQLAFLHGFAISDFVTDVIILSLPVPMVTHL